MCETGGEAIGEVLGEDVLGGPVFGVALGQALTVLTCGGMG